MLRKEVAPHGAGRRTAALTLRDTRRMQSPALRREIKVLHLEDSELDHELAVAHLRRDGLRVQVFRVETREQFERALQEPWDVVLSDYNLPGFTGVQALGWMLQRGLSWPFILISGEIGEETAVEAMRSGASDYVLKDNMARLAPAMERAIAAFETQQAREAADRELQASRQRLSELAQHLQTSIERERAAIAREIHDDVGGSLTALKFEIDWIRRHVPEAEVQRRVQSALETVTQAIEATQRVMHNLRPAILDQGLLPALQWLSQGFSRRTSIECALRAPRQLPPLPAGVALVAWRTAQEALTNVSKHAQAHRVEIDLSLSAGVLQLEVHDDGRGLAAQDLAKAQSFGIRGLHERASTVGGWIDLSSKGRGTTLILTVPLPRDGEEVSLPAGGHRAEPGDPADGDPSEWNFLRP